MSLHWSIEEYGYNDKPQTHDVYIWWKGMSIVCIGLYKEHMPIQTKSRAIIDITLKGIAKWNVGGS